jgi:hypothetical protein
MNKAARTSFRLVLSIVLLTAVALAHTRANTVDKNRNREHHSRLSKLAFWRGHKGHDKAGVARVNQNKNREQHSRMSKLAFWRHHKHGDKSAKTAQVNPASLKPAGQQQARSAAGKGPAKTRSAATRAKPQQTTEERTTALKQ